MQIWKLIVAAGMSLTFVTLENPKSASLKKVCGYYARIGAWYSPLARLSGRNAENDLLV
jgi:hypothetical protein